MPGGIAVLGSDEDDEDSESTSSDEIGSQASKGSDYQKDVLDGDGTPLASKPPSTPSSAGALTPVSSDASSSMDSDLMTPRVEDMDFSRTPNGFDSEDDSSSDSFSSSADSSSYGGSSSGVMLSSSIYY